MPLLETPGHAHPSLAQSRVRTLLLSPGSRCAHGFVCALQESVSPVLWKFFNKIPLASKVKIPGGSQSLYQIPRLGNLLWALELLQLCENFFGIIVLQFLGHLVGGSMVGLMATSSQRSYATCFASHVCYNQSPCLCSRLLLTRASIGDTQMLKGMSGSVSCGVLGTWCAQGFV